MARQTKWEILLGLCAILSNVEEVIEQKPAEKENRREHTRMISILYYFMLQKQCRWTSVIRI